MFQVCKVNEIKRQISLNQKADLRTKKRKERENNLGCKKWRITAKLFIVTTPQVIAKLLLLP